MKKNNNDNFDVEKMLDELSLSSPVIQSIMFYVRNKANDEAIKLLKEENVSEKDSKKIIEYLFKEYCSPIEIVEIKIEDVDRNDILKVENYDKAEEVTTYLVRFGDILQKSKLCENPRKEGELVFYLNDQPPVPLEKIEQIWKIVKINKFNN